MTERKQTATVTSIQFCHCGAVESNPRRVNRCSAALRLVLIYEFGI